MCVVRDEIRTSGSHVMVLKDNYFSKDEGRVYKRRYNSRVLFKFSEWVGRGVGKERMFQISGVAWQCPQMRTRRVGREDASGVGGDEDSKR